MSNAMEPSMGTMQACCQAASVGKLVRGSKCKFPAFLMSDVVLLKSGLRRSYSLLGWVNGHLHMVHAYAQLRGAPSFLPSLLRMHLVASLSRLCPVGNQWLVILVRFPSALARRPLHGVCGFYIAQRALADGQYLVSDCNPHVQSP